MHGPKTQNNTPLLDIDETARLLNTTPRFVRRLVQERRVPYLKVGRFIRFDPHEIDTWLDQCRHSAHLP
jgi:excisionase family DNA binding protein